MSFQKDGKEKLHTTFGAIIFIFVMAVNVAYGTKKFQIMQEYGDTIHQNYVNSDVLDET